MTVPTGAALRASARFDGVHDQDIVNVYNFLTDFATPQAEQDVFDAVDDYLSSVYVEFDDDLYSTITPVDLKVDVVEFVGGKWMVTANVGFGSWGSTINTTDADDPLPPGSAAVSFLYTNLGKHQGRKFFGGFTEGGNSLSGAVGSDVLTRIALGVVKLLTPHVIAAGNDLITVVLDTVDGTIREILSIGSNAHWGYQRRRRPGVGS